MIENSDWLKRASKVMIIEFVVLFLVMFAASFLWENMVNIPLEMGRSMVAEIPFWIWVFFSLLFLIALPNITKHTSPFVKGAYFMLYSILYSVIFYLIVYFLRKLDIIFQPIVNILLAFPSYAWVDLPILVELPFFLLLSKLLVLTIFYILFRKDIPWKNLKFLWKDIWFGTAIVIIVLFKLMTFFGSLYTESKCANMVQTNCWVYLIYDSVLVLPTFEGIVLVIAISLLFFGFLNTLWSQKNLSSKYNNENPYN